MTSRQGFTLIEVMFVTALIGILSAMAIPGLHRARLSANEASAEGSMRVIASAQQVFASTCGGGFYSPSLQNLGLGPNGGPGYVTPDLSGPAPVVKSGFEFDVSTTMPVASLSCNGDATAATYHATADPLIGGGRRYFGTNGEGVVYESAQTLFGVMPDTGAPPAPAVPLGR